MLLITYCVWAHLPVCGGRNTRAYASIHLHTSTCAWTCTHTYYTDYTCSTWLYPLYLWYLSYRVYLLYLSLTAKVLSLSRLCLCKNHHVPIHGSIKRGSCCAYFQARHSSWRGRSRGFHRALSNHIIGKCFGNVFPLAHGHAGKAANC